jgi:hypothetical protein
MNRIAFGLQGKLLSEATAAVDVRYQTYVSRRLSKIMQPEVDRRSGRHDLQAIEAIEGEPRPGTTFRLLAVDREPATRRNIRRPWELSTFPPNSDTSAGIYRRRRLPGVLA